MRRGALLVLALAAPAASAVAETLVANSTVPDTDLLDGGCDADLDTPGQRITLRAAVQHANVTPGEDEILLHAGRSVLRRKGGGEDAAATGDLDVPDDLVITGADAAAPRRSMRSRRARRASTPASTATRRTSTSATTSASRFRRGATSRTTSASSRTTGRRT